MFIIRNEDQHALIKNNSTNLLGQFYKKKITKQTHNISIVTITDSFKKCLDKNGLTQLNGTPNLHFLNILNEFNLIVIKFRIKVIGNFGNLKARE